MSKINFLLVSVLTFSVFLLSSCDEEKQFIKLQEKLQTRLDNGETPLEIMNDDNKVYDIEFFGLKFQGGTIFGVDKGLGKTCIISEKISSNAVWGCMGVETNAGVDPKDGNWSNSTFSTQQIIDAGCLSQDNAASLCLNYSIDGYDDWVLPTIWDLDQALSNPEIGGSETEFYWASNEEDANRAQLVALEDGNTNADILEEIRQKDEEGAVRAVRIFWE